MNSQDEDENYKECELVKYKDKTRPSEATEYTKDRKTHFLGS